VKTILIVDDDDQMRSALRLMLEKNGFSVLEACSGVEAEELCKHEQPALVLMDIILPREHGLEAIREILVYDPAAKAWSEGPPLSVARDTQLVVAAGRLYALGGFNGMDEASMVVERLTSDGSAWELRRSMYDPVSAFSTAELHGGIFTFGDYTDLERVFRYDVAGDSWQELQVDFLPRRHSAAATVGDRIVVVGGTTALKGSWMATTEVFVWTCAD